VAQFRASFNLNGKRYPQALAAYRALVKTYASHPETATAVASAADTVEADGRPEEALGLAELYLKAFPKGGSRAPAARIKARSLAKLKRSEEALAAARTALQEAERLPADLAATRKNLVAALMLLGELSGSDGAAHYSRAVKEHPDSPFAATARYQLAYLAWNRGQYEEALTQAEALLKALAGKPEEKALRRKALFAAADAAFKLERYKRAESHLSRYVQLAEVKADPAGMQLHLVELRLAWCRSKAKDPKGAVANLDRSLARNPSADLRHEMLYLRGRSRLDLDDLTGARTDFAALVKAASGSRFSAHACYDLAEALYGKGRAADALPWLDRLLDNPAFKEVPVRADGLLLRAKARFKAKQLEKALEDIDILLKGDGLREQRRAILFLKALCLEGIAGRRAEAEEAYGALIKAGPESAEEVRQALVRRGRLRFDAKRYGDAKADLAAFLGDAGPKADQREEQEASLRLAMCLKNLKETAGARTWLERLDRLELKGAMAFEVRFQLGNLSYEAGENAAAAKHYLRALADAGTVKKLPKEPLSAAWLNLAWARVRSGQKTEAAEAFRKLLEVDPLGPYSSEARYHRGSLLAESGNVEGALAIWQELLEKQPEADLVEKTLPAMGEVQAKAGQFAAAAVSFQSFLAKYAAARKPTEKTLREVWCGLAECLVQTKKSARAREAFLKALGEKGTEAELDEIGERALLGVAELDLAQGKAGDCKKHALDLVIKRPGSKWLDVALYLCGRANEELASPEKAIASYRELVKKRPKSPRAKTARERLKALGAPLEESGGPGDP
jgi:tetratricopeptide (TPR) repeat protein